jgi:homocitrate synthase NifV
MVSTPVKPERIILCDTTLRDGEQAPGVAFSVDDKLLIARMLDRVGVTEIEAGTPASGGEEAEAVRKVARMGLDARISAWCRAVKSDIDAALACDVDGVAVTVPASAIHLGAKLKRPPEWAVKNLVDVVRYAKGKGLYVCAALEDASRAELDLLLQLVREAGWAGADRIRISDTVGQLDPFETAKMIGTIANETDLPIEFHGHNDFGLATANALAAARAGATHLSVTVLGMGERAGNAALEEVALALERLMKLSTGIRTDKLLGLFHAVSEASGRPIPVDKPVAGREVFSHESGIHVDGVLKSPETYEPFPPEAVGRNRRIAIGKHSGSSSIRYRLGALGVQASSDQVEAMLKMVRQAAIGHRGELADGEVYRLWKTLETLDTKAGIS